MYIVQSVHGGTYYGRVLLYTLRTELRMKHWDGALVRHGGIVGTWWIMGNSGDLVDNGK